MSVDSTDTIGRTALHHAGEVTKVTSLVLYDLVANYLPSHLYIYVCLENLNTAALWSTWCHPVLNDSNRHEKKGGCNRVFFFHPWECCKIWCRVTQVCKAHRGFISLALTLAMFSNDSLVLDHVVPCKWLWAACQLSTSSYRVVFIS